MPGALARGALLAAHPLAKVKASKIDRRANVRYLSSEEVARLSRALEINRIERDGRPDNAQIVLPEHGFVSRAAQSDAIFVYSLTTEPTLEIGAAADRPVVETSIRRSSFAGSVPGFLGGGRTP